MKTGSVPIGYSGKAREVQDMFASIAKRYDLANSVLSFGTHHVWRRALVGMLPRSSDKRVLDLCTGTADLVPLLEKRFGRVTGADFCLPMLEIGKRKIAASGSGAALCQSDAHHLPFADESFDIVTVAFGVRNFECLETGLCEISRVLAPGGKALVLEFGQPWLPGFGELYSFYSARLMPLIGGWVTGNRAAYQYLPRTAGSFPCRDAFESILKRCGFAPIRRKSLTFGIAYAYLAEKRVA